MVVIGTSERSLGDRCWRDDAVAAAVQNGAGPDVRAVGAECPRAEGELHVHLPERVSLGVRASKSWVSSPAV